MKCPYCSSENVIVLDSRSTRGDTAMRRRRQCLDCKRRFTTIETLEFKAITVIKKSGKREPFSEEKLQRSINTALPNMAMDKDDKEEFFSSLVLSIYKIASENKRTITSVQIGDKVLEALKEISSVAYIRFASVYKEFSDVKQIIKEIKNLDK